MTALDDTPAVPASPSSPAGGARWEICDHCRAPLDERQRYCIVCGTRCANADDPAVRHFATARRALAGEAASAAAAARPAPGLLTAVLIALVPVVAAVGVLVGRGGSNGEERVLAALRAQKAPVVTVVGAPAAATRSSAVDAQAAAVPSDFPRTGGFSVALQTLPVAATTATDVAAAVGALTAKGAAHVRVVGPADFVRTPAADGDVYTLVSGRFARKAEATRALRRLRRRFPGAAVIALRATRTPTSATAAAARGPKVLTTGPTGSAHQLEGAATTKSALDEGAKAVDQINKAKGKAYVDTQRNLPDSIAVP